MNRPAAHEAQPGHAVVPRAADERWRAETSQHRCSFVGGKSRVRCNRQAVAELNRVRYRKRGPVDAWYCYCPQHLADYGRWVEDGTVMQWVAVPVETVEVAL